MHKRIAPKLDTMARADILPFFTEKAGLDPWETRTEHVGYLHSNRKRFDDCSSHSLYQFVGYFAKYPAQ